ncbi:hypothetical protein HYT91_01085 [Candidatus Pacearchaeota archaeon]|nr:hypothetical protein [Candidatus Pacearchaeota archaeon]
MLTTYDLYKRQEYNFKLNDLVEFKLLKGYKLRMHHTPNNYKKGIIAKSNNKNPDKKVTGTIVDYNLSKLRDLEIKLIREDRCEIKLKLSQCKDLKILS